MNIATGWWDATKHKPPENTLIQFLVKTNLGICEYWGAYDGYYRGYVSSEGTFPMDFETAIGWKVTELSTKNYELKYKIKFRIKR